RRYSRARCGTTRRAALRRGALPAVDPHRPTHHRRLLQEHLRAADACRRRRATTIATGSRRHRRDIDAATHRRFIGRILEEPAGTSEDPPPRWRRRRAEGARPMSETAIPVTRPRRVLRRALI